MANVLLIDDDEALTEVLADALRDDGHVVAIARDGDDGLLKLHAEAFDVILCDVDMPGLDGRRFAALLARDVGFRSVPLVFVSGADDVGVLAMRIGTPYFLVKPFGLDDVHEMIDRAVRDRAAPGARVSLG